MRLYRPVTVVVGLLFVVAGGAVRLLAPDQFLDAEFRGRGDSIVGQSVRVKDSEVAVNRIRFAKAIVVHPDNQQEEPIGTDGVFVAVEYDVSAGAQDAGTLDLTLETDEGTVYTPARQVIRTTIDFPQPGFTESTFTVFEVNPDDITGLTLWLRPTLFWTVLTDDYAVDLGVPGEEVGRRMVAEAADEYAFPKPNLRVTP